MKRIEPARHMWALSRAQERPMSMARFVSALGESRQGYGGRLDSGVCQDCGGRGEVVRRVNPTGAIESANMVTLCRRCSDKRDARRRIERETDAGAKAWMLEVERVRA